MITLRAKQLMAKYLLPSIVPLGFLEKKGKSPDFEFVRKASCGEDVILGGFTDYSPVQQIIYSLSIRNKHVNAILLKLQDSGMKLIPKITKTTDTIGFSYSSLNGLNYLNYLPDIRSEEDIRNCVGMMSDFLKNTAFPIMDKFNDLREIDKVINGEDAWTTDWQMPYAFGGNFHLKRLIIAKLSGLKSYERMVSFVREDFTSHFNEKYAEDYRKALTEVEELDKILRDVKPLY